MTNVLMLFLLKLTLLLASGAALAVLLRRRSAATRHFVWALTLCSAVVLAIVVNVAPPLTVAIPDWRQGETPASHALPAPSPLPASPNTVDATPLAPRQGEPPMFVMPSLGTILAGVWLTGFMAMMLWSIAGHAAVSRIARGAVPADDAPWSVLIEESLHRISVTRPVRIALSPAVAAPFTSGWSQPIVLLPSDASTWPEDRRRAALMHELAHIERNDYLIHLLAGFACALYWFHPVAWFGLRRLRRESEQATDDRVIARGMIARDYATHLLDVARAARSRRFVDLLAVGMACPSHLETRLRALLDETRIRSAVSRRRAALAIVGVAILLVPLAVAHPVLRASENDTAAQHPRTARAASTYQRVVEASPGGTLVLDLETGASVEVVGDDDARVEITGRLGGRDAYRTVVDTKAVGDEIRVTSRLKPMDRSSSSTSHSFVVHVPRRFNVRLSSSGGGLSIDGVEGTFEGMTGGGEIELTRLHGRAELTTGGGDIDVTDSDLDGNISTGGGTVRFKRVRGGLQATSGSGQVVNVPGIPPVAAVPPVPAVPAVAAIEPDGPRHRVARAFDTSGVVEIIEEAGGSIDLAEAPHGAVISTGGGQITVGRARGTVDATTGGGRIIIGPVAGSVRASTGGGTVDVKLVDGDGQAQTVDVTTGNGNVIVELPSTFEGRFEIETAYTESHGPVRIQSAWSLQNEPVTDWDARQGTPRRYVRAHGSAGSARGLVRIRAVNGNVTLRRGN